MTAARLRDCGLCWVIADASTQTYGNCPVMRPECLQAPYQLNGFVALREPGDRIGSED